MKYLGFDRKSLRSSVDSTYVRSRMFYIQTLVYLINNIHNARNSPDAGMKIVYKYLKLRRWTLLNWLLINNGIRITFFKFRNILRRSTYVQLTTGILPTVHDTSELRGISSYLHSHHTQNMNVNVDHAQVEQLDTTSTITHFYSTYVFQKCPNLEL